MPPTDASADPQVVAVEAPGAIARAVEVLRAGRLLGLPTETVYGLAADAGQGEAVAGIFAAKDRPRFNPLIAHVCDLAMAERIAILDAPARSLAERFWPGSLTLVLPRRPTGDIHDLATGGLDTVAIRMPQGPATAVIAGLGRPVVAPSANRSGRVSATSAAQVVRGLGDRVALVLDAGASPGGVESTIVRAQADRLVLLRAGMIPREALQEASGLDVVAAHAADGIQAPGQLASHYAPHGRVRLNATHVEPGEHLIGFGPDRASGAETAAGFVNLSETGDLAQAASNLFAALAGFDAPRIERIAVEPIPTHGLGEAINDRLTRAAAPRP